MVSILDPVRDISMGGKDIEERHRKTKVQVSKALYDCLNLAFPEWNEHIEDWAAKYPTSSILPDCPKYIPTHCFHTLSYIICQMHLS